MGKFRCKNCGAEYDSMPRICETPGCNNSNPAMWEVIVPSQSAADNNVGGTASKPIDKKEERFSKKQSRKEEKSRIEEQQQIEKELPLQKKRGKKRSKRALLIVCLCLVALLIIAIIGTEEDTTPQPDTPGINDSGDTTPQPDTPDINDDGDTTPQPDTPDINDEENPPPQPTKVNIMMADEIEYDIWAMDYYVFGNTTIPRNSIVTIEFIDNFDTVPRFIEKWDISKDRDGSVVAWTTPCNDVTLKDYDPYNLHIAAQGKISPESCKDLFSEYKNLVSIDFNNAFDTSNVTDMCSMFNDCVSLIILDVTSFDTSKVTDMRWMFADCISLKKLDVTNFDTSNVTDMYGMFVSCKTLKELDVTNFNTSKVTCMTAMFAGCISLKKLDVTNFDTSNVTDMGSMFSGCDSLEIIGMYEGGGSYKTN